MLALRSYGISALYIFSCLCVSASFQDDVAIFRNQMQYDANFILANLERVQTGYQLLHHKLPMIGSPNRGDSTNNGSNLPDASSINNIYSMIEYDNNNVGHLHVYVEFKKSLPRQNIAHLLVGKSIRYTALDPNGKPMVFTGPDKGRAAKIITFSCDRLTSESNGKFALSKAGDDVIDLVYFLPYPFNYCR